NHLENRLEFSPVAGSNDNAVIRSHQAEAADNEFPADDNNDHPSRKLLKLDQTDQRGTYQKLVRQRVHKFSEIRYQIIFSGNLSVQKIRKAGHNKNRSRQIPPCGIGPVFQKEEEHKKRYHDYSQNR